MDKVKANGFKYSTISAATVSAFDLPIYSNKDQYFVEAENQVNRLKYQFQKGLLTDDERYKKVINL
ncbi:MAG: hypothetical protein K2M43_01290 [Mycoplasmoidaceae bacterium]|nr:hypothetical protein [Mycoplasmoidaceae bacterium]